VNLVTVFIAVFFISLFEATLQEKIALAILMPVVASMGGIAGTQTLILVRSLAKWICELHLNICTLYQQQILGQCQLAFLLTNADNE
jgi:Mg/Co/Ni transporter MgtE